MLVYQKCPWSAGFGVAPIERARLESQMQW
jgi:hypothetical protein